MQAKEYLNQIRKYDILIDNKKQMIFRLYSQAESITAAVGKERFQSSGSKDKIGDIVAEIVDLRALIRADVEKLTKVKAEVVSTIDKVGDADLINVLYKRYVHYKSWTDIADEMNFTERNVQRLHGKALLIVQKLINPEKLSVNVAKCQ